MNQAIPRTVRVLIPISIAAASAAFAQTVPPAPGEAGEDEIISLSPFEVSAEEDRGYQATSTLAGTRIRTDLKDVGTSISVVTKDFLNDIGATDSGSLLQYTPNAEVAGVRGTYAGLGNGQSIDETASLRAPAGAQRVRGLAAPDTTRDFFITDIPWDSYNVDRIDIQRGANSFLFGLGSPAGLVNAALYNAEFRNFGSVEARFGSYDSFRTSVDLNQEIIDQTLAIRLDALYNDEHYKQDPAYQKDERLSAAVRFDPQLFKNRRDFRTSIKAKFEHGEITANRPRIAPPNDHISPWFRPVAVSDSNPYGGLGKLLLSNGYNAEREDTPPVGGDGKGITRSADPDYNAWVGGQGNQQQPIYFIDGATNQLYSLYGGYVNKGALNADGTPRSASSALVGLRYSGVFYGVGGLPNYATQVRLPGYQYGQYREQSLTDASVFDFYNNLIDGPNKHEWEDWDAYNINFSQTAFDDRLGLEVVYDRQKYYRGGEGFINPTLNIDILQSFQDLSANPNVGRPYVAAGGGGSSYRSDREHVRGSLFAELRTSDFLENSFLVKLLGKHRFNGVYGDDDYYSENRTWNLHATSSAFDDYIGTPLPFNDRPPIAMVYLGPSVAGRDAASGASIPRIQAPIELNDGSLYHFSSQWAASGVNPGDAWTVPASLHDVFNGLDAPGSTTQLFQNSNPANYRGWNSDYDLDILRYRDGDQSLTTNAAKARRRVESFAGTWQSFWWDGALVGTAGWRYDHFRGKDVTAAATGPRSTLNLDPAVYGLPKNYASEIKEHSTSWGAVLHINKLFSPERDPLPINVSLSYNTSNNFQVSGTRRNLLGDVIGNPTGETKDYGLLLATKDNRFTFRAVKYESNYTSSSTQMSGLNWFGDIISYGLRWRNVFLYNLNAYTLDTANGSNEWRYNFDPDTSIGETQEQATAREEASIAAWNEIQASLPQQFYDYWGFTPPSNLANPDPSQVQAYKLWGGATPQGLTLTSDTKSEGYEFELTANPTPNWRIAFNASKTEATRTNVGSQETVDFVNYMNEMMAGPAGELRVFSGGPTALTLRQQWNSFLGNWTLFKLQEGAAASEIRPWRYNVVTNYAFRNGFLKGVGVGGSYRWQDKVIIGYPVVALDESTFTFDLDKPYHGPSEDAVDLWASYERKLTKKISWKIQLNVRNAFAKEELIPISVQPDGQTWASARIAPNREWFVTNTFSF